MRPGFFKLHRRLFRMSMRLHPLTVRKLMAIVTVFALALGAGVRLSRDNSPRGRQWRVWIADLEHWTKHCREQAAKAREVGDRHGERTWTARAGWFRMRLGNAHRIAGF